jgi:hypothetical protein
METFNSLIYVKPAKEGLNLRNFLNNYKRSDFSRFLKKFQLTSRNFKRIYRRDIFVIFLFISFIFLGFQAS